MLRSPQAHNSVQYCSMKYAYKLMDKFYYFLNHDSVYIRPQTLEI
jgi:hypothetical protein